MISVLRRWDRKVTKFEDHLNYIGWPCLKKKIKFVLPVQQIFVQNLLCVFALWFTREYLQSISTFSDRISLELADWLLLLTNKLQGSCLCLSAEIAGMGAVPDFLHGCWQSRLRSSCLPSRSLICWVISPAQSDSWVLAHPYLWPHRIQIDKLHLVVPIFLKSENSRVAWRTQRSCLNSKQALPWNRNLQKWTKNDP